MPARLLRTLLASCIALLFTSVARGQIFEKVYDFGEARAADFVNRGKSPAALVQSIDGYYYGTTSAGGARGFGTLFRMSPTGVIETLIEFTGLNGPYKGSAPAHAVVFDGVGNLYGTTQAGGALGYGTIFKLTPSGVFTTLIEFTDDGVSNRGSNPVGLIRGRDGNFYGATYSGAIRYVEPGPIYSFETITCGTIFKLTPAGVFTTLVEFNDPSGPRGIGPHTLVQGSDGNLYGTTRRGGASSCGTFFKVTTSGTLTTLLDFTGLSGAAKGRSPRGELIALADGNFYGVTNAGGAADLGTVFRVTPAGALTTLAEFSGTTGTVRGALPDAALVQGSDGNLYGSTTGTANLPYGTLFRLSTSGTFTHLLDFTGASGSNRGSTPNAALIQGADGFLYGTTSTGGAISAGTLFRLSLSGTLTTLADFSGTGSSSKLRVIAASLTQGPNGDFYGLAQRGGANDLGSAFRITPAGVLTTLFDFTGTGGNAPGSQPSIPFTYGSDGNFYLALNNTSDTTFGDVVRMTPAGALTRLVQFTGAGSTLGKYLSGKLTQGNDGNFYGVTESGGPGAGTVFKMTPSGTVTTLVQFNAINGYSPEAGLTLGNDGNFYGTTIAGGATGYGNIFKITSGGALTNLVDFTGPAGLNKGTAPRGELVQGSDGNFYGTTFSGGSNNLGTIFKVTPSGTLTTLAEFTGTTGAKKGSNPSGPMVQGSDGNFYGTTQAGGTSDAGTLFQITQGGTFTTLMEFSAGASAAPASGLIRAADGNLWGTTYGPDGSIFRIVLPGAPTVAFSRATTGFDTATIEAQVNARGTPTTAVLEYGSDGITFPNSVTLASSLTGLQTRLAGTTVSGLASGSTYTGRLRATSAAGSAVSSTFTFGTLALPTTVVAPADGITGTSAVFHGVVNAQGSDTAAVFEWGTDGNTFSKVAIASPATVTGKSDTAITASVSGFIAGDIVYYRIRATNSAGAVTSGVSSFSTVSASTTAATLADVGVSEATFRASVNTYGRTARVKFRYWPESAPTQVMETTPQIVVSSSPVEVTARATTGLQPGLRYLYQVSVEIDGVVTEGVGQIPITMQTNAAPVALPDLVFYRGAVTFNPLLNDADANNVSPAAANAGLSLTRIVAQPMVAAGVARITGNGQFIGYIPQFNVLNDDSLTYEISDPQGALTTGTVRLVSFSKTAGSYAATLGAAGSIAFDLDATGSISLGSIAWRDSSTGVSTVYRLRGSFDSGGQLSVAPLSIPGGTLEIVLQLDPDLARITGSVTERNANLLVTTLLDPITLNRNAGTGGLPRAGLRTAFFEPPEGVSGSLGTGYLLLNVPKTRRTARVVGQMPDGTRFSAGVTAAGLRFPLITKFPAGGMLAGNLRLAEFDGSNAGLMATLAWQRPGTRTRSAVNTALELHGVDYPVLSARSLPPIGTGADLRNVVLRFTGGPFQGEQSVSATITGTGASGFDTRRLQLRLQPSLGTFSGKFRDSLSGQFIPFNGAIRAPYNGDAGLGAGVLVGRTSVGSVRIESN